MKKYTRNYGCSWRASTQKYSTKDREHCGKREDKKSIFMCSVKIFFIFSSNPHSDRIFFCDYRKQVPLKVEVLGFQTIHQEMFWVNLVSVVKLR